MLLRIIADLILILAALTLPWWTVLAFAVAGVVYFDRYYEALIAGLLIDVLFGAEAERLVEVDFFMTIAMVVVVVSGYYFKRSLYPRGE